MNPEDAVVSSGNLSVAWAQAFLRVFDARGGELAHPLLLSITEFNDQYEPIENGEIRSLLDQSIAAINKSSDKHKIQGVSATASTIFPHMCWSPRATRPAAELFSRPMAALRDRETCPATCSAACGWSMADCIGFRRAAATTSSVACPTTLCSSRSFRKSWPAGWASNSEATRM